jgi:NitT/TauT family transport system permease protein
METGKQNLRAMGAAGVIFRKTVVLSLLLLLWEILSAAGLLDPQFVPSFSQSVSAAVYMFQKSYLFMHAMVSLARVSMGLIVAALIGVPLAYCLEKMLPRLGRAFEPMLRLFGLINPYCLFPLFVVIFGLGEAAKIAVLAWVGLWPIFFGTLSGLRNIDPVLIKTARSMGAGGIRIFYKAAVPAVCPYLFAGVRIGVEMAFFILIAAEMTGATAGLGWIVHNAGAMYQVPRIYGAGIIIVALGFSLNRLLIYLDQALFPWRILAKAGPNGKIGKTHRPRKYALALVLIGSAGILAVGIYEIILAETILNDPAVIPEYRVWTE